MTLSEILAAGVAFFEATPLAGKALVAAVNTVVDLVELRERVDKDEVASLEHEKELDALAVRVAALEAK